MTKEERDEMMRKNYVTQLEGMGYGPDGLALSAKEPEPRVLTLREAKEAEYCVMELRDSHELYQFVHDPDGGYFSPQINTIDHPYFETIAEEDEYNVHVRCWSKIPTNARRLEVKWDD